MTLSTDSGVPYPKLDASGSAVGLYMAGPDAILETIRELVQVGFSWGSAAAFATANTASVLGLSRKGRLVAGTDADILILEADGRVDRVYARVANSCGEGSRWSWVRLAVTTLRGDIHGDVSDHRGSGRRDRPRGHGRGPEGFESRRGAFSGLQFVCQEFPAGAKCCQETGTDLPDATLAACKTADAILFGSAGLPSVRLPDGTEIRPQIKLRKIWISMPGCGPIKRYAGSRPSCPAIRHRLRDHAREHRGVVRLRGRRGPGG